MRSEDGTDLPSEIMWTTSPFGRHRPCFSASQTRKQSAADESLSNHPRKSGHPVSGANRKAASVADLPDAWTVPQRNRAVTRKATILDPVSNELSNSMWKHTQPDYISACPINQLFPHGESLKYFPESCRLATQLKGVAGSDAGGIYLRGKT
jgi:hypothetical protein